MKKITIKQMKFFLILFGYFATSLLTTNAQCIRTTAFGTVTSNNSGLQQGITTCAYSTVEYSTVNGLIVGEDYMFSAQVGSTYFSGNHIYVTLTDTSNNVIQHGLSPQTITNVSVTSVRIHLSDDSSCAGTATCHNTSVMFLPSCPIPSGLTASNLTTTSADISWSVLTNPSNGYEYYYSTSNTAPTATTTPSGTATTTTANLTGLTASTTYYFWIRSNCTSENSIWSAAGTFDTVCNDLTDFVQNFDSSLTGTTSPMPVCWSKAGTGNTYVTTGATSPMSPSNRLYMFASGTTPTEAYAILPSVSNLQANTHRLKFKSYATIAGRFIEIGYMTDLTDITTFIQLEEVNLPGTAIASTQEFIIVPTGIPAGVKNLVIKNPGYPGATTTAYIDDVIWEAIPACPEPVYLTATNIGSASADLSWTELGSATLYNIEYGPTGFTQGTGGTVVSGVANPYNLSGLSPQTTYDYYVQADCGTANGTSVWVGPYTFTTACVSYTAPYTENFDSLPLVSPYRELPICWEPQVVGNDYWTVTNDVINTGHTYLPNIGDHTTGTSNYLWIDASTNIIANEMISPLIDMSALTTPLAGFWFASNNTNNAINHTIALDVWDGSAWLNLTTETGNFTGWVKVEATVPSTVPTTTKFRIYAIANPAGTTADYYFNDLGVDDFYVIETPLTAPNCATNPISTPHVSCGNFSNTLSWDADPTATGYYITVGTTSGGNDIANNVNLTSSSYSFVGNINATYYWTVTPYNANGSASGCLEQTFTTAATGCYCTSLPTSNDDLGITNVQLGSTNFPTNDVTYFDHTSTTVSLSQAVNTNVQITFATGYTYDTYIWIDFNDDFTLETSEIVYSGVSTSANPTVLNASFNMPASAPLGIHRMRIVTADDLLVANPCYSGAFGVTLDFSINILPAPSCIPPTNLSVANITNVSADLGWTENGTATVWDIEWGTNGFTPTGTPNIAATTTNPYNLTGLTANTAYSFYVRANCGGTNGESAWSGPYNFLTTCDATNVPYVMDFESATVPALPNCTSIQNVGTGNLWTVANNPGYGFTNKTLQYLYSFSDPANVWFYTQGVNLTAGTTYAVAFDYGSNSTGYVEKLKVAYGTSDDAAAMTNVIVDLTSISNNTPLNSSTQFTPTTSGVYYFGFNVYSDANQYNLYVDNINVDVFLNSSTFDNASFIAYPNPVKDVLNVSYTSEISSVKVINLLGQEVISRKVGTNSTQIDMTSLTAGAYIVNVTVGDVLKTIKVIKQ
ncbi:fibronectin type III domain-containing protein [uncultured Flavobacterium sp.]|uniref:fibronectin type III domain-containing protein n=1 Tax=uncultured Flavobacterium sp. TaxID=165435 RepID=UPI0030C7FCB8